MRSENERWTRVAAGVAWVAVVICAAYAAVNFTRKDWRDFTPVEQIGFFTPDSIGWGPPPTLAYPPREIVTVDVRGATGSFLLVWPNREARQRATLARVGAEALQVELVPSSDLAKAIDACLDRGIQAPGNSALTRQGLQELKTRLARSE